MPTVLFGFFKLTLKKVGWYLRDLDHALPLNMAYTEERFRATLRIFQKAKLSDEKRARGSPTHAHTLRIKYDFRHQLPPAPTTQASRWLKHESDSADDDYNPSGKKEKKKQPNDKPSRVKRKAPGADDEERQKKRSKIKCSSTEELRSKVAFITIKARSEAGRALLSTLAARHGTVFPDSKRPGPCPSLGNAGMDTFSLEMEERRKYEQRTFEENFQKQIEEIDNVGGRALRTRKVPEIHVKATKARDQATDDEMTNIRGGEPSQSMQRGMFEGPPRGSNGLLTPASSPPEDLGSHSPPRSHGRTTRDIIILSPSPTPPPTPKYEQILTRWAHPMDFQYVCGGREKNLCNFCADLRFGIYGLPRRMIWVERTGDANAMFKEVRGTINSGSDRRTRMCIRCAFERFHISFCGQHELRPLSGIDPKKPELPKATMMAYISQIRNYTSNKDDQPVHPACSICPQPALYHCCKKQPWSQTGGTMTTGMKAQGCGLLACVECQSLLAKHNNILKKHIVREHVVDLQSRNIRREMRADLEFLFRGSLLYRAYNK
jgi:hypothetical protein